MLFQNLVRLLLLPAIAAASTGDAIEACYGSELISTPSNDNRTAPWGSPSIHFSSLNGTLSTCCTSLDEIRTALDDIDDQLLDLLSRRWV